MQLTFKDSTKVEKEKKLKVPLSKKPLEFSEYEKLIKEKPIIPARVIQEHEEEPGDDKKKRSLFPKNPLVYRPKNDKPIEEKPRSQYIIKTPKLGLIEIKKINLIKPQISGKEILEQLSKTQELRTESTEKETHESEPPNGEGSGQSEDLPDAFEKIFGISSSEFYEGNNIKIILYKELENDDTIETFETFCKKFFREIRGGSPKYKPILQDSDFNRDELENWITGEGCLIRIDLDVLKLREKLKNQKKDTIQGNKLNLNETSLKQLLLRTIGQKLGFIILFTKDKDIYDFFSLFLNPRNITTHELCVYEIEAKPILLGEKKNLSKIFWGNLKIPESIFPSETLDQLFNKEGQELYTNYFKVLETERGGLYKDATNPNTRVKSKESPEHFMIKVFILKMLIKQKKIMDLVKNRELDKIKENIHTEVEIISEKHENIPDISVDIDKTVYEVETLFGKEDARKTLNKTINKYEEIKKVKIIKIVLENFTMIRHLKDISDLKWNYKSWAENKGKEEIEFYTLDLQYETLIPFEEFKRQVISVLTRDNTGFKDKKL